MSVPPRQPPHIHDESWPKHCCVDFGAADPIAAKRKVMRVRLGVIALAIWWSLRSFIIGMSLPEHCAPKCSGEMTFGQSFYSLHPVLDPWLLIMLVAAAVLITMASEVA